ncbi:hypothetical protein MMC18_003114 [Xylographa bjoerkii]|nr:hypothetical protein [Xylographa bjoerkii]
MLGKIVTAECGCEFRACGAASMWDSDPSGDVWDAVANCGCMFRLCGHFTVRRPAPTGSVATPGGGVDGPLDVQSPASHTPQPGRPPMPHAPPPAPRPAFAHLPPTGPRGRVPTPVEKERVNPIYLRIRTTPGAIHPNDPRKKLPRIDNVLRIPKQRVRNRREKAARDAALHNVQPAPEEEYPGLGDVEGSSTNHLDRAAAYDHDSYDIGGLNTQHGSCTRRSSNTETRRVRFLATSEGALRRGARLEGISRREARRETTSPGRPSRNTRTEHAWEEVEDGEPEIIFETDDSSAPPPNGAETYTSAPSSFGSMEAQYGSLPRPQHSLQGRTRRSEYYPRRHGALGLQMIPTWDLSHVQEERFEPVRPHPAVPDSRGPFAPNGERIRAQRPLQTRPPRYGGRRAGKEPEERVRRAPVAPRSEGYPLESDASDDAQSPQLGQPGPSAGRRDRANVRQNCDGRRRRNGSLSLAAESSEELVSRFGELDVSDEMDRAW